MLKSYCQHLHDDLFVLPPTQNVELKQLKKIKNKIMQLLHQEINRPRAHFQAVWLTLSCCKWLRAEVVEQIDTKLSLLLDPAALHFYCSLSVSFSNGDDEQRELDCVATCPRPDFEEVLPKLSHFGASDTSQMTFAFAVREMLCNQTPFHKAILFPKGVPTLFYSHA